jgi:hypothetical protein
LEFGRDRCSLEVRAEVLTMSAASIDRYLKTAKAKGQISGVNDETLTTAAQFDQGPQSWG